MDFKQFGPFKQLFENLLYAKLLHLVGAEDAILEVQKAIRESTNLETELKSLLEEHNWRPNLVAGVALLMLNSAQLKIDIWETFDRGSWVNPQLTVVAYFYDPKFSRAARERLDKRCATDDENYFVACSKMASLVALGETISSLSSYVEELTEFEDVEKMLQDEKGLNNSGEITRRWLQEITKNFEKLGLELVRAES